MSIKIQSPKMFRVKEGDEFLVTAIFFQVPDWSEGSPCVIINPVLRYTETAAADSAIEDLLIDIVCKDSVESHSIEDVEDSLQWAGKSLSSVMQAIRKSLKTQQSPYKSIYSEVVEVNIRIIREEGELSWVEINKKVYNQ